MCLILTSVLQVLLVYKEDQIHSYSYVAVSLPLFVSIITLMLTSFGTKAGNQCKLYSDQNSDQNSIRIKNLQFSILTESGHLNLLRL